MELEIVGENLCKNCGGDVFHVISYVSLGGQERFLAGCEDCDEESSFDFIQEIEHHVN